METNTNNKKVHQPTHTVEHILNQTMIRMFGCERSKTSHIERKKSKCDYILNEAPSEAQIQEIESRVNAIIAQNLPVSIDFADLNNVPSSVDLSKLPDHVSQTIRLVYVGDYDICACIGEHVQNTSEIGTFKMLNWNYEEGKLRLRFKVV